MKDFIVQHPLTDRSVYGIGEDGSKTQIGTITCVTPEDWVMYWSDAKWKFVPCVEGIPASDSGTMQDCEQFVYGLFNGARSEAA
ncbi:hypothetical protein Lepto7375DRAFT_1755 [Leptolyngbya sp. PCC 7375]|nr:hypothetical protein Lepto7375DRAFT_1755 [Leptolyngbya sp. PCC 7375]